MTQPTLFDIPAPPAPTKRKRTPKPATQRSVETIPQTLARYARDAAAIRAKLRQVNRTV